MTEVSKRSAIDNAQEALEPGEQIERVFLAPVVPDPDTWKEDFKRQRAGEPARELPLSSRYQSFAVMASDRNLYVFPQTGQLKRGLGAAAKILATGDWTPLDISAGQKHPLGSIRVTREGKRLQVGDLEFKIVRINRKDADALISFLEKRSRPAG